MKHSYSNDDTCFSIDVIDEILEEHFDALLDEGSKILYSIEGTPLEDKIFAEFDEFIAMNIEEITEPKNNEEEIPFEKITFNTNYKIKNSLNELPTDLELKPLSDHLEYAFLEEPSFLPDAKSGHSMCQSHCASLGKDLVQKSSPCDDEDDEPTPQPKIQTQKPAKETPLPKPYKLKISYPQRLRKEKMEAQYGKFLDMIRNPSNQRTHVDFLAVMQRMENFSKNS
ncbi:hypothetical protein Tco_1058315 [Tanacetum coccineum]|uniref:Reverse transcriptase domain-containing protein n=1 Tax=Tanacetum coccineum TaxID=301880 RepID=A0ABQ5H7Y5_9ASTR